MRILVVIIMILACCPISRPQMLQGAVQNSRIALPVPLGQFPLNEGGAATSAIDLGSGTHNGTWSGTQSCSGSYYTTSALAPLTNAACVVSSATNKITWGNLPAYQFAATDHFSFTAWVNVTIAGTNEVFAKLSSSTPFPGYTFRINSTGHVQLDLINSAVTTLTYIEKISAGTVGTSAWHFIAATYDGSATAAGVHLYIDGVPSDGTVNKDTLGASSIATTANANIGADDTTAPATNIHDEDFRIYFGSTTGTLSSPQISAIYTKGPCAVAQASC